MFSDIQCVEIIVSCTLTGSFGCFTQEGHSGALLILAGSRSLQLSAVFLSFPNSGVKTLIAKFSSMEHLLSARTSPT